MSDQQGWTGQESPQPPQAQSGEQTGEQPQPADQPQAPDQPEASEQPQASDQPQASEEERAGEQAQPSEQPGSAQLAGLEQRLDQLTELIQRRVVDDKSMKEVVKSQQDRIQMLDSQLASDKLTPLLRSLRLVIERAGSHPGEDGFGESIAEEIIEAIEAFGIDVINETGPFDPSKHEAAQREPGSTPPLEVVKVVTLGFAKAGRTLVPARVVVGSAAKPTEQGDQGQSEAPQPSQPPQAQAQPGPAPEQPAQPDPRP